MRILDACCGSRMFWNDKNNSDTIYMDIRRGTYTVTDKGSTRTIVVDPDLLADCTNMPFPCDMFDLVIFDPPHLRYAGPHSWLKAKYGILPHNWQEFLRKSFDECMRVLKPTGTLVLKWNNEQIPHSAALQAIGHKPLLGDQRSKTRWSIFTKQETL